MKIDFKHKKLADGRWQKFTLQEQMGNIGSEVYRAARFQNKDEKLFKIAVEKALELFDLTLADPRLRGRLREIGRAREVFCDAFCGGELYGSTFKSLMPYFDQFAFAA